MPIGHIAKPTSYEKKLSALLAIQDEANIWTLNILTLSYPVFGTLFKMTSPTLGSFSAEKWINPLTTHHCHGSG